MRYTVFLATLVGIMFIPLAAANTATVDFRSPSEAVMVLSAKIEGEQASDMREYMDYGGQGGSGGNGDGTVTQNEVDAVEAFFKGFFEGDEDGDSTPTGSFTVDGKGPSDFALSQFDLRDATGPVTSTSAITMFMEFNVKFDITAGDRHTVRLEAEESNESEEDGSNPAGDFEIESATLKAPSGYIIESATGLPEGASVSSDKKEINYKGLPAPEGDDTVIVFAKGGAGSPGFGFIGLVAALGFVAAMYLRSRKD